MSRRQADGTDFWIVLDPPPHDDHYVTNSDVTGNIVVVADKDKPDYKCIEVSVEGGAMVRLIVLSEIRNSTGDQAIPYIARKTSSETYTYGESVVAWSKVDTPGNRLTAGSHTLSFSLKLSFSGPPTFKGSGGRIFYEVQARIIDIRDETVKSCKPVPIRFVPFVDLNVHTYALEPKTANVRETPMCWGLCCCSGPISLTAHIPRTGYCCTGVDAIRPLEVHVKNDSCMRIRYITAKLKRVVRYIAEDEYRERDVETIAAIKSDTAIRAGCSQTWKPPPFSIPETNLTSITNCSIIKLSYYLKVEAVVFGTCNPYVKCFLVLGNVPMESTQPTV